MRRYAYGGRTRSRTPTKAYGSPYHKRAQARFAPAGEAPAYDIFTVARACAGHGMEVTTVTTDGPTNALLAGVREVLDQADDAVLAVAFVRSAGVHFVRPQLQRLRASARLVLTTTFHESSALQVIHDLGVVVSVLNPGGGTYHPKMYLGRRGAAVRALIGSANLTGGLVNNVEAAVLLRGTMNDEPIRAAWDFAERLCRHPRCRAWAPGEVPTREEPFPPDLLVAIQDAVTRGNGQFSTLAKAKPNRVAEVTTTGVYVQTDASRRKGNAAELIPAWMFTLAYEYLQTHGRLTNRYLVATDGLNVKRSSGVIAILAALPGIAAHVDKHDGIVLRTTLV